VDRPPTKRPSAQEASPEEWRAGRRVAVRNRFTGGWTAGFLIEGSDRNATEHYRLRRLSDDAVLPVSFAEEDLRPL
jgi:hypothetical protein